MKTNCEVCGKSMVKLRANHRLCGSIHCRREDQKKRNDVKLDLCTDNVKRITAFLMMPPLLPKNMYI